MAQVLTNLGASLDAVRRRVVELLGEAQGGGLGDRLTHRPELPNELSGSGWISRAPSLWHQGRVVACSFCGRTPPASGHMIAARMRSSANTVSEYGRGGWSRRDRFRVVSSAQGDPLLPGWPMFAAAPNPMTPMWPDEILRTGTGAAMTSAMTASRSQQSNGAATSDQRWWRQGVPSLITRSRRGDCRRRGDLRRPRTCRRTVLDALDGQVALGRRRGDAVIEDGIWKMARSTFCQLMGMEGVQCPPE